MKSISVWEALKAIELVPVLMNSTEPIGPLNNARSIAKLESAINQPFISFGGVEVYPGMNLRAAALFYFLTKDHCFENGNKRTAVVVTMLFLFKNKKMFNFSHDRLYEIACIVAMSPAHDKDEVINYLENEFQYVIVDVPLEYQ